MLRAMSNLSAEDVKAWYNQHYAAKGLHTMRPHAAYPLFLDLLGAQAGSRLLDVSCGAGSLLAAAEARDVEAVGVDLSDEAVRLAQRGSPSGQGRRSPFGRGRSTTSPASARWSTSWTWDAASKR